jgi:rhodanese-related sulfurtransferase
VDIPVVLARDLKRSLDRGEELLLVDVRIAQGGFLDYFIDHSARIEMPLHEIINRYRELPSGKKIIIIDMNGQRAPVIGRLLISRGFSDIAFLSGGMDSWVVEGLPVKTRK